MTLWSCWWIATVQQGKLVAGGSTWTPGLDTLGVDFLFAVDRPARFWLDGIDPYDEEKLGMPMMYPPLVPKIFSWVGLTTTPTALCIWLAALALMAAGGTWYAWQLRNRLGYGNIPLSLMVATVLFSTPVVFAMERGNIDLLIVPLVIAAVMLLRRDSRKLDFCAGALLAVAPWLKVYPGLLGLGLISTKRWHALAGMMVAGALIGLSDIPGFYGFARNNEKVASYFAQIPMDGLPDFSHSLSYFTSYLVKDTPLAWLSAMRGVPILALLLGPMLLWVSYRVYRSSQPMALVYPYLMWLLAAATFVPIVANDYNLMFLPLAALATWRWRDHWSIHVCLAALLLWWQPLEVRFPGNLLFLIKLFALGAVGMSLAARAAELPATALPHSADRPAGDAGESPAKALSAAA